MKIGIACITHKNMNGGTKYQTYLAKEFSKLGHEIHFYLMDPKKPEWFDYEDSLVFYHPLQELSNHSGDLLIMNWNKPIEYFVRANLWKRKLLIVHDTPTAIDKNCVQRVLENNGKIGSVSSTISTFLTSLSLKPSQYNLLYPGYFHTRVNQEIFKPINKKFNENKITIGYVKNSSNHDRNQWFRGVEETEKILSKIVKKHPNFIAYGFNGKTEKDMAKHYQKCDIFMEMPYLAGCPTCVIEALCCGLPVITTYHGTQDHIINNLNGLYLPKNNVEFNFEIIEKYLIKDLEKIENMIRNQRLHVYKTKDLYTWKTLAKNILEFMEI